MKRTSSLGRRSSTQSFQCSIDKCDDKGKKKSMLLQPGFMRGRSLERNTSREPRRSTSLENLCKSGRKTTTMKRSSSQTNLWSAMTPVTPKYSVHANLPSGSKSGRPDRSLIQSTDSARVSSIGGVKILRKDIRPLTDKAFINQCVAKIQNYLQSNQDAVMMFGEKIKLLPMTTALFVDLVAFLTNKLDVRIPITRSNYQEELPSLLKKIFYRGKVERSWLITVNAPHSFPHVIGLLEWLVTIVECKKSDGVEDIMYPDLDNEMRDLDDEEEIDLLDFKILKPHLMWYYEQHVNNRYDEEAVQRRDELLGNELLEIANVDDLQELEREDRELEVSLNTAMAEEQEEIEAFQVLKERYNVLRTDKEKNSEFIMKSKVYIESTTQQISLRNESEERLQKTLERKQAELQKIQSQVQSQEINISEKAQIDEEKLSILETLKRIEESYNEIDNLVFKEDLQIVSNRKKLDDAVSEYNKVITENRVYDQRLKNAEIDSNLLSKDSEQDRQIADNFLEEIESEYKAELKAVETEEEECLQLLNQVKEKQAAIADDIEVINTEKTGLAEESAQLKQTIQLARKKIKEDISKLQSDKKDLLKEINDLPKIDMELFKEKQLELKDSEDKVIASRDSLIKFRAFLQERRKILEGQQQQLLARARNFGKLKR